MPHIFISYSPDDRLDARRCATTLRQHGYDVWLDPRLDFGDAWYKTIKDALADCAVFLPILTVAGQRSPWVQREFDMARAAKKPIVPLEDRLHPTHVAQVYQPIPIDDGHVDDEALPDRLASILPPKEHPGRNVTPPPPSLLTQPLPPVERGRLIMAAEPPPRRRWTRIFGGLLVCAAAVLIVALTVLIGAGWML